MPSMPTFDLFAPRRRTESQRHRELYAMYQVAHTAVDFVAAICFTVGSVLFFWKATETAAIWLFVVGSLFFLAKPSITLAREIHYIRLGRADTVAQGGPEPAFQRKAREGSR